MSTGQSLLNKILKFNCGKTSEKKNNNNIKIKNKNKENTCESVKVLYKGRKMVLKALKIEIKLILSTQQMFQRFLIA